MRRVRLALAGTVALVAVLVVSPHLPTPSSAAQFRIAAYATHAVWFALVLALATVVVGWWHVRRRTITLALVATFAIAMSCNVLGWAIPADIAKVWFGSLAGAAFVRAVERPWWLLPIALAVPIADVWSVFSSRGVTKAVIDRAQDEPRWIEWPTIATPIAGVPYELFGRLGTVDILFAALFVAVAARWRLGVVRTAIALWIALVANTIVVLEVDGLAIPALPLICLGFVVSQAPALVRDARAAARDGRT